MRDLFTEVEMPRVKQIPPHPHVAGMGFKAPTGKKLRGNGEQKFREEGTTSWHCRLGEGSLFLGCWRLLTKTWQNPPHFPHLEGTGKEGGCPRRTHRFNPFGFGFNLCRRRHVQR